ncbi:MAG: hypothetical protein Q9Q40_10615, partial [Acidobacteriota bacterium]|nr:hypothetical protein [Acidobacteriota bacterium]
MILLRVCSIWLAAVVLLALPGCPPTPTRHWRLLITWPQPKMREARYVGHLSVEAGRVIGFQSRGFDTARGDFLDRARWGWSTIAGPRDLRSVVVEIEGSGKTRLTVDCGGKERTFLPRELDEMARPLGAGPVPPPLLAGNCRVESLAPASIEVRGPSIVQVGQAVDLEVVVRAATRGADPAHGVAFDLQWETTDPKAELPAMVSLTQAHTSAQIIFRTPGLQQVRLRAASGETIEMRDWPVMVRQGNGGEQTSLFWGDLQAHTRFSSDSAGKPEAAYRWAREEAGLDFVAITDHHWS